jgi:hypothetical protein
VICPCWAAIIGLGRDRKRVPPQARRTARSIVSICNTDAGSVLNPVTCKREGFGMPLSRDGLNEMFQRPTDYDEVVVTEADTLGIFVERIDGSLQISQLVDLRLMPGYEDVMGVTKPSPEPVPIRIEEVARIFPELPMLTFEGDSVVQVTINGAQITSTPVNVDALYGRQKT